MTTSAPVRDAAVLRPSDRIPHDRGGGCSTVQLVTPACGASQLINGITTFAPGAAIGLHWHNCEESVMVLEGDAVVVVGDVEHPLKAGDTTWLPPNVPHFFRNASQERPMRIFWTYASANATRTLAATKEERPIAEEHSASAS
jgi:putative monooxygenase